MKTFLYIFFALLVCAASALADPYVTVQNTTSNDMNGVFTWTGTTNDTGLAEPYNYQFTNNGNGYTLQEDPRFTTIGGSNAWTVSSPTGNPLLYYPYDGATFPGYGQTVPLLPFSDTNMADANGSITFFLTAPPVYPVVSKVLTHYWQVGSSVYITAAGWNNSTTSNPVQISLVLDTNVLFTSTATNGIGRNWKMSSAIAWDGTNFIANTSFSADFPESAAMILTNDVFGNNSVFLQLIGDTNAAVVTSFSAAPTIYVPGSVNGRSLIPYSVIPALTVSSSSASTMGYGAGLMASDSNYLYVSIGTNLWGRIAIPTNTW